MPLPEDEHRFEDRRDAGRRLASKLLKFSGDADVLVLAFPRGGVPVAYEIAVALAAPLDVFLVRKLRVPGHDELSMGAIASGGTRVLNDAVIRALRLDEEAIAAIAAREWRMLCERELDYRGSRSRPIVQGHTVILVDDGLTTGATLRAAVEALNEERPKRLIVAAPVVPPDVREAIAPEVDEIVCALAPTPLCGIRQCYADSVQTTDEEIRELLGRMLRGGRRQRGLPTAH